MITPTATPATVADSVANPNKHTQEIHRQWASVAWVGVIVAGLTASSYFRWKSHTSVETAKVKAGQGKPEQEKQS